MKHNDRWFWHYALAYFLVWAGLLVLLLECIDGNTTPWAGLIMIWLGVLVLTRVNRARRTEAGKAAHQITWRTPPRC